MLEVKATWNGKRGLSEEAEMIWRISSFLGTPLLLIQRSEGNHTGGDKACFGNKLCGTKLS